MDLLDKIRKLNRAYIIAEAADAHYGSLSRAKEMAIKAKKVGADAIKFQHHLPFEEMLKDVPTSRNMKVPLFEFLTKYALKIEQHIELSKFCTEIGIQYLCTPFSWKAAQELIEHIQIPVIKIGSGEMNDLPTLEKIADAEFPMLISTGMSEIAEIDEVYNFLVNKNAKFAFLNCTSGYPPKMSELNLGFLQIMQDRYRGILIGHSDHTPNIYSSIIAITLGAKIIEKHVTIDEKLEGPDADASITFQSLKELVEISADLNKTLSNNKMIHESEKEIRNWARRSLVYCTDLKAGHIITIGDFWGKRPGTGIPSKNYWNLLGKKLKRDVRFNTLVKMSDFEDNA